MHIQRYQKYKVCQKWWHLKHVHKLTRWYRYDFSSFMYFRQNSHIHNFDCFPYSSGYGEKYHVSISYLPICTLSIYFTFVICHKTVHKIYHIQHRQLNTTYGQQEEMCRVQQWQKTCVMFHITRQCFTHEKPSMGLANCHITKVYMMEIYT